MTSPLFIPLFMGLRGMEWIVILLVVLLLFGGKKIPELMRGLGKGVKSFKQGVKEAQDELNRPDDEPTRGSGDSNTRGKDNM